MVVILWLLGKVSIGLLLTRMRVIVSKSEHRQMTVSVLFSPGSCRLSLPPCRILYMILNYLDGVFPSYLGFFFILKTVLA